jgi:2-C-methyl-D-erythritol 2,4-cyclodiphosphate synthase
VKVGFGYDSHCLVQGRALMLCGVEIPFEKGLDGWSDADVALHAVIDAICGAAGLCDIGTLFPPGDERYHGVSSVSLLEVVNGMVRDRGLSLVNVDVTIVAERPMLAPHTQDMRNRLGSCLKVSCDRVSVKAKSNDGMGFVGRGEGIAAFAVVLLEESPGLS